MSAMSGLRRKLTAHKDLRINNARRKIVIQSEQRKPDYQKLTKDERRGRISAVLSRIPLFRRRAS